MKIVTAKDLGVNSTLKFVPTSLIFTVVKVTKKHIDIKMLDRSWKERSNL